jgi:hypothetical protein
MPANASINITNPVQILPSTEAFTKKTWRKKKASPETKIHKSMVFISLQLKDLIYGGQIELNQ